MKIVLKNNLVGRKLRMRVKGSFCTYGGCSTYWRDMDGFIVFLSPKVIELLNTYNIPTTIPKETTLRTRKRYLKKVNKILKDGMNIHLYGSDNDKNSSKLKDLCSTIFRLYRDGWYKFKIEYIPIYSEKVEVK